MKSRLIGGCIAAFSALTACATESPITANESSVDARLQLLPTDTEARAKALDELLTQYPDDRRVQQAADDFEAANTPGLLRTVELSDGRKIKFIVLDTEAFVAESGKHGQTSIIGELGLSESSPTTMWRQLLPNEEVPTILLEMERRTDDLAAAESSEQPANSVVGTQESRAAARVTVESDSSEVAVAAQACFASADDFLNQGGCALSPTPGGAAYTKSAPSVDRTGSLYSRPIYTGYVNVWVKAIYGQLFAGLAHGLDSFEHITHLPASALARNGRQYCADTLPVQTEPRIVTGQGGAAVGVDFTRARSSHAAPHTQVPTHAVGRYSTFPFSTVTSSVSATATPTTPFSPS